MPFRLFQRGGRGDPPGAEQGGAPGSSDGGDGIPFEGLTEEWRLRGVMAVGGRRLADVLNRRDSIPIHDVQWAPADGSEGYAPAPGLKAVDPYDLIVVILAGKDLPSSEDADRRAARRLHKVDYDVALDCPPYRVVGTVHLFPGSEPDRLMERQTDLFVAVTDAITLHGARQVGEAEASVALVNRSYLRGVEQVDRRTMAAVRPLPGRPLGGTSYHQD